MKAKKTIRKLHHQPATRKLAHWQRDYVLLGRRMNTILALVGDAEFQLKALEKENAALRAKLAVEAEGSAQAGPEHTPPAEEKL